jgi:hypothetical protein
VNQRRCIPPKPDCVLRELADWAATLEPGKRRMAQAPASATAGAPVAGDGNWRDYLIVGADEAPKAILANAITALRQAPAWDGVLGFNEFSLGTVMLNPAP